MIDRNFKVSVIIPVFNSEISLPNALNSLIYQTTNDIEVVVINDGSEGNCDEIIEEYRTKLNINYIKLDKNYGRMIARLVGMKNANGEYIGFLDADDTVEKDMYLKMYETAKKGEADIVHCLANYITIDSVQPWEVGKPIHDTLETEDIFQKFLDYELIWSLWDKLFKREIVMQAIPEIPYDRVQLNEDTIISCVLFFYATKYMALPERLYNYYYNDVGAMSSRNNNNVSDILKMISFIIIFCKKHGVKFKNKALIISICQWPFDIAKIDTLTSFYKLCIQTIMYSSRIGIINILRGLTMSIKFRYKKFLPKINLLSDFKTFIKRVFRRTLGLEIIRESSYHLLVQQANNYQLLNSGVNLSLDNSQEHPIIKSWLDYFSIKNKHEIIHDVEELIEDTDDLTVETVKQYVEFIWETIVGQKKGNSLFKIDEFKHVAKWEIHFLSKIKLNYCKTRTELIKKYNMLEDTLFPNDLVVNGGIDSLDLKMLNYIKGDGIVLDCGAFRGETAAIYDNVLSPKQILAFEPIPENYKIMTENINRGRLKECVLPLNYGVYNINGELNFTNNQDSSLILKNNIKDNQVNQLSLQVRTIDSVIDELMIENIRLIKLDVEDSEIEALDGGKNTIKRNKPILFVSIYHSANEFFNAKKHLLNSGVEYKYMIRNMDPQNLLTEKVLIAIPKHLYFT